MRHCLQGCHNRMTSDISSQPKTQGMFIALERFTLNNVTQSDQCHLIVWNFDTHIAMTGYRRLNTDTRRGKRESKIICQRRDLVDAYFCTPGSCLNEQWLHAKLRDCWSAIDLYHL